jgi:hypothetical protein
MIHYMNSLLLLMFDVMITGDDVWRVLGYVVR